MNYEIWNKNLPSQRRGEGENLKREQVGAAEVRICLILMSSFSALIVRLKEDMHNYKGLFCFRSLYNLLASTLFCDPILSKEVFGCVFKVSNKSIIRILIITQNHHIITNICLSIQI